MARRRVVAPQTGVLFSTAGGEYGDHWLPNEEHRALNYSGARNGINNDQIARIQRLAFRNRKGEPFTVYIIDNQATTEIAGHHPPRFILNVLRDPHFPEPIDRRPGDFNYHCNVIRVLGGDAPNRISFPFGIYPPSAVVSMLHSTSSCT